MDSTIPLRRRKFDWKGSLYYEHRNERTCLEPFGNVSRARAQKRQEYYTTLLEKRQAKVVRIAYFEGLPWDEVAREVGVAVRTVHKIKIRALEQLAGMYQFTGQHS